MATTMQERAGVMARPRAAYFYVYMAMSCLAAAFLGFAPTYWMPLAQGTFRANPVVHIHGLVFFAWTVFFVFQSWLAASGRVARHRAVGLIGVSFATAMTIFGVLVVINMMKSFAADGADDAGKAFALVPLAGIVFFAICVIFALANVRRPEWHKRLMLVATVSLLEAPVARWFFVFVLPPGPPSVMATIPPAMFGGVLLVIAIVHDWRQRGRPHPAYLIGLGVLVALKLLELPLSTTAAWHQVASGVLALAG